METLTSPNRKAGEGFLQLDSKLNESNGRLMGINQDIETL
jgi:hypothetical protein